MSFAALLANISHGLGNIMSYQKTPIYYFFEETEEEETEN